MKTASVEKRSEVEAYLKKNPSQSPGVAVLKHLHRVARTFVQVQQKREDADYDLGKEWTQMEVLAQIDAVAAAFESWNAIRDEPAAQAYLLSLLGRK